MTFIPSSGLMDSHGLVYFQFIAAIVPSLSFRVNYTRRDPGNEGRDITPLMRT